MANGELVELYKSIGRSNGTTETAAQAVLERFAYDVWGTRRNASDLDGCAMPIFESRFSHGAISEKRGEEVNALI